MTDYCPRTLKMDLKRRGRLPPVECVDIGLALTTALAHLHGHGLVHRDIIFVGGVPKLADIGLVTDVDASRSFVGTEGFLPPEGPGTPQADIYCLGKVLYEMSTGRDRKDYPTLPLDRDALDPAEQARLLELNEVLVKVCEVDPRRRYQTAEQLREDLELLTRGESVRCRRAVKRRVILAKKASIIAAVLSVPVIGSLLLFNRFNSLTFQRSNAPTVELKSIAVLPFDNEGPEKRGEYLGAQMTEELGSALSKIPGLRVIGRQSATAVKNAQDSRAAAQQLGLGTILDGRLRRSGTQLYVPVQLIKSRDGSQLWSDVYNGEMKEILAFKPGWRKAWRRRWASI